MKNLIRLLALFCLVISSQVSSQEQPAEQWAARYNGTGNSVDWAYAIKVDAAGYVYVTGYSNGAGTSKDYCTIKYNSNGVPLWTATYNGPVNGGDYSFAIAVSSNGNVYVTGRCDFGGSNLSDITTIKYNSSGVQQWVVSYNGTGSIIDEGKAIILDNSENVYVTGKTFSLSGNYDFITIKYDQNGNQLWAQTYNGPGNNEDISNSIDVDGSGNVYIAGESIGSTSGSDFVIIKYNSSGTQQWINRFNGLGNGGDAARVVKVDGAGNVFATGYTHGEQTSFFDFLTIKYNSSGVPLWQVTYNGSRSLGDFANAMVIDQFSNVYVTGSTVGMANDGDSNFVTIKYNTDGSQQWVSVYTGPNNSVDVPKAILLDNIRNVYVTGASFGLGLDDYATIKYSNTGSQLWAVRYNGPANSNDYTNSMDIDQYQNIYVTGRSFGIGSDFDYATVKYSQLTGIEPVSSAIPDRFYLSQNYPNPFNPSSKVEFGIPYGSTVSLIIYDVLGAYRTSVFEGPLPAGKFSIAINAGSLSSGVYFYTLRAGNFSETRKMIVLK